MSSILKALKKLEEEKTSHEDGKRINVSSEILRQQRHNGNSPWLLRSFAALAVVIIIILTSLLLTRQPERSHEAGKPLATVPSSPPLQQQPAPQSQPQDFQNPRQPLPPPAATAAKAAKPLVQETVKLPEPAKPVTVRKFPLPELPGSEPLPLQAPQPQQMKLQAQPSEISEPNLTLSGIAWNKDSAERLAIINGQPASTGSRIGSAVVEEILPDRVRLSSKGRVFELSIGRSVK